MLAELAPLAVPQFDALLVSLFVIVGCLVAIGLIYIIHHVSTAIVGGIGGLLGKVPWLGGILASPVNATVQWMNNQFSEAETYLDAALGRWLHSLAELARWVSREIRAHAHLLWLLANVTLGADFARSVYSEIGVIHRLIRNAEAAAAAGARAISHAITAPVVSLVHSLERRTVAIEHGLAGWVEGDIKSLRERARTLTDDLSGLYKRLRRIDALIGTVAFSAAVSVALSRLGLSWVRCSNWKGIGKSVCSLPSKLIEDLLLGVVDVLVVTDLCAIVTLMTDGAKLFAPELDLLVKMTDGLIQCQGAERGSPLAVTWYEPPAVANSLAL